MEIEQRKRLEFIALDILNKSTSSPYSYSLMGGKLGEIMFLYYYSLIDNTYEEKSNLLLDQLLENISAQNTTIVSSYCSGFAGLGFALHMLEENGFIEGSADMLDDIDLLISYQLNKEIQEDNYDFLHGVVGIGFYFLKHYKYRPEVSLAQIKKILAYLYDSAIYDDCGRVKWTMIDTYDENKVKTNISLSHGMSSILIFLIRVLEINLIEDNTKLVALANSTLDFLIAQQIDRNEYGSYFPNWALENTPVTRSRLAWCYGDLGIGIALWRSGKVLKRQDAIDLAKKVYIYSATRKDVQSTTVCDAGLCHGAAGVAQMFFRMSKEMQLPELYQTYQYWKEVTLKMAYHQDGIGGYKIYKPIENEWCAHSMVLEGTSGIGLFLLSEVNPDWDEILLLNFK